LLILVSEIGMSATKEACQPVHPTCQWVKTPEGLQALADRLRGAQVIALDTESDSLHSFPEKVCLVQLAEESGAVILVDPLALGDLSPLAGIFADPGIVKIFHGASYDLASLKRGFGFEFAAIFDTMIAAQFLGLPMLGLASLLEQFFGIPPGRSRQKDDWAERPLSSEQEFYAAEDVRHLIPLRRRLVQELQRRDRVTWVEEECQALAVVPAAQRIFDPEEYVRLKGGRGLDGRGLAVLRELYVAREAWAHEAGRPPFKVLGNELLVRLAAERPRARESLGKIPGCSPRVVQRHGEGILAAIAKADAIPEAKLPTYPRARKPRVPPTVQRRIDALTCWRAAAAEGQGLDPGLLLPRRLVERLAEEAPATTEALRRIKGLRRWRTEAFGQEILAAMAAASPHESAGGR
jgi:ribonuclease D